MNNWYSDYLHGNEYRNDLLREAEHRRLVNKIRVRGIRARRRRQRRGMYALRRLLGRYLIRLGSRIKEAGTRIATFEDPPVNAKPRPRPGRA
ncbi:hypothetical protein [Spirochaeta lutea]|uniref:Uncharacterized protein n=1 Tax=Spirochaeta lutea TaxID=1480694 RepID=A0A098QU87_9SPIO|nr:hypothetical protein [Spirochaeta lutea]KGE70953.1 hypothetical protein DC28_13520 [Spirochaeta lutea]